MLSKVFFVVLGALCLILLPAAVNAQCWQCDQEPPSPCVSAPVGAGDCITDFEACQLVGVCRHSRNASESCSAKPLKDPRISIPDSIIREVGAIDARLAVALVRISKIKAEFTVALINFSSLDYTFDDVENRLTQPADSLYFKQLARRIGEQRLKDKSFVTYDVSLTENLGDNSFRLNVSPAGKTGAAVELTLQRTAIGEGKDLSEGFRATSYQIK